MLMFKNFKEMVPIAIRMLFARSDQYHNYYTRQSRSLHPSVGKGEAIYRSFSFHGVNIWNYLSKHIPTNVSYNHFNKLTKSYVLNNNIIYRLAIQYFCILLTIDAAPTYWGHFLFCFVLLLL